MKALITIVIVIVLVIVGVIILRDIGRDQENDDIRTSPEQTVSPMITGADDEFEYEGVLEDVTGGNASGVAMAGFDGTTYRMRAEFENLPELEDDFFYEGWVVRPEPFEYISTGKLELENGVWINEFESNQDLTDHFRYVLTLEPDDGDPAPADHVVEGDMTLIAN